MNRPFCRDLINFPGDFSPKKIDDEIPTSGTNSAVLISPTSMISNNSAINVNVPSSQSAQQISLASLIGNNNSINNNSNNSNNNMIGGATSGLASNNSNLNNCNNNNNNNLLVHHSQSAHQLGQPPLTPLSHHQALQQQLQKHFANSNLGECLFLHFDYCFNFTNWWFKSPKRNQAVFSTVFFFFSEIKHFSCQIMQ